MRSLARGGLKSHTPGGLPPLTDRTAGGHPIPAQPTFAPTTLHPRPPPLLTMDTVPKLQALHPTISKLREISSAPGLSLGVLHRGSVIHTSHFGRKNVDYPVPPDDHTLCS